MDDSNLEAGEKVLHAATEAAHEVFGEQLNAVFALGSLAHGGFTATSSDVDVALVLDTLPSDISSKVDRVKKISTARARTPLTERLSIFWTDWHGVHHGTTVGARLPAVDRLDLLDDGRLLLGRDGRAGATRPDRSTLVVEGAEFACALFDDAYLDRLHEPAQLVAEGARTITKTVLFPVRFCYTLSTGRLGHNGRAADWYRTHGAHPALADAAMRWRENGIANRDAAVELLTESLVALHVEFFDTYATALDADGNTTVADALRERWHRLSPQQVVPPR